MINELISLDLETSGKDIESGVTILSIGIIHLKSQKTYYAEAKHDLLMVEPSASRVHKLDMNSLDIAPIAGSFIAQDRKRLSKIDLECRQWLQETTGITEQNKLIILGWNVASFDMPFVRKFLPKTAGQINRRSIDLNALCFLEDCRHGRGLQETKGMLKRDIENTNPHDALADAIWSAKIFEELVKNQEINATQ